MREDAVLPKTGRQPRTVQSAAENTSCLGLTDHGSSCLFAHLCLRSTPSCVELLTDSISF